MKRIRLPRNISLNAVFVYIALFCVSTFALLEHITVTIGAFSPIKLYLMYVGFICILTQINTISRNILKKKYFYTLLAVFVFCVLLGISMLANRGSALGMPLYNTVRFCLYLVELFALMIVLAETGRGQAALKFLFGYTLLIVLVNDTLMFSKVITFGTVRHENYIVGTKFSVSYLHMDLLTLWLMIYSQKRRGSKGGKWGVLLAAVFLVLVTLRTDCMTGLLGCILLAVMFSWLRARKGSRLIKLASPGVLSLAIAVSVLFIFVADAIVNIPGIKFVVEEVLNRNTSITGRTNIYHMFVESVRGQWLQGYGYGNDNATAMALFGYANVQNGLMQWVFQIGIPATFGMLALFVQVFRSLKRSSKYKQMRVMPLVILIYIYIVLATIETTFNMAFIMWFALIFMLITEKQVITSAQGIASSAQIQGVRRT